MTSFKLPEPDGLNELLGMIVGGETSLAVSGGADPAHFSHIGRFLNDTDELVAFCCTDLPLSAALGAALSMIPPGVVEEMVEDQELTPVATENLYEVMNMLSSLYMNDSTPHLRLSSVDRLSGDAVSTEGFDESTYQVSAGKYGDGQIAFYAR